MAFEPSLDAVVERTAHAVIGAAIEVHRHLGPGLLESQYERALVVELGLRGLEVAQQVPLPMLYKGTDLGELRLDLVVDRLVIVELKSVQTLLPIHLAQALAYIRAARLSLGLVINFNTVLLREGIRRVINP